MTSEASTTSTPLKPVLSTSLSQSSTAAATWTPEWHQSKEMFCRTQEQAWAEGWAVDAPICTINDTCYPSSDISPSHRSACV